MKGLLEQPTAMTTVPQQTVMGQQTPTGATAAPPAGQAPTAMAPAEATTGAGEFNKEELDIFIANGMRVLHNPTVSDAIIGHVADAKNSAQAVAEATLNVISRLEQSAKGAGKPVSLTTVAYGANTIMGEIITSAEAAGMKKMDDKTKYQAFSMAVAKYLDEAIKSGKLKKEDLIQMGKQAEESPMGQKMAEMAMKQAAPNAGSAKPAMPPAGMGGGDQNGIA